METFNEEIGRYNLHERLLLSSPTGPTSQPARVRAREAAKILMRTP